MASSSTDLAGSSSVHSSSGRGNSAIVDQLSEELFTENAILLSLQDLPDSVSTKEEKEAVKLRISKLQRKIAEARRKTKSGKFWFPFTWVSRVQHKLI